MAKVMYLKVVDDDAEVKKKTEDGKRSSYRYTRSILQSTLQLMGCKSRHAFKV